MAHTRYQETERSATDADDGAASVHASHDGRDWVVFGVDLTEWRMPGLFAAVTVVVALIGILVANRVEPLTHPVTPTTSAALSAPATTSPNAEVLPPADGSTAESTATTTVALTPAKIELSTDTVDFGPDGIAAEFDMTNTGETGADWTAVSSSEAIAFSASTGSLAAGDTVTLRVSLDRSLVAEGEISETITIQWGGGEAQVAATGSLEDNPIIHNPQAKPAELKVNSGDGCSPTQTTVSARIRDTSKVESAVVRWSPDGSTSKETPMIAIGNDMFEGVVGPFSVAQSATVKIVAFDEWGNAGGASITIPVNACP